MTLPSLSPALQATVTWLGEGARSASRPEDVFQQLCNQLKAAGLAIDRAAVFVRTLHPSVMARRFLWNPGQDVDVEEADYALRETETFRTSTVPAVMRTGRAIRRHLADPDCPADYNIVEELQAEGFTDYIIHPLDFLNGEHHAVSWATRRDGGFTDLDIVALLAVRAPLARIAEIHALRRTAGNLLDTYVGHRTGQRILEGKIRRGDVETISAAVLMADLRGFTALSNTRPAGEVIAVLNDYYDALVPAIEEHGGEILKFMGDGLLAIFPIDGDRERVCDAALRAAEEGQQRLSGENEGVIRCGMALHLGEVLYGNIGSAGRLDFTTIGPAVNLTARLEPLTRELDRPILTSAPFAAACSLPLEKLGSFTIRGFDLGTDVFAPTQREEP